MLQLDSHSIKLFLVLFFISLDLGISAQGSVGINTETPQGVLDIVSPNSALIITRNANPTTNVTAPKAGMIIYNSTDNTVEFYDGTAWVKAGIEPWMVSGTTNKATLNTQNIYQTGRVGVGVTIPTNQLHVSAVTNPVRIEGLKSGTTTDSLLSIDATGIANRRSVYSLRRDIVNSPTGGETPFNGMIRFNSTNNTLEYYNGTTWMAVASNTFNGRNEGVVRIDGGSGGVKPTFTFITANLNTYSYINYTLPLTRPISYWPENLSVPTDANIVGTNGGNTTYIENPIIGQVHTWRIMATFSSKAAGTVAFVTLRLRNPLSGFTLQQTSICPTALTTGDFTVNFISIADPASLPAPTGTGVGYHLFVTSDTKLDITINSITRISSYKD